MFITCAYFAFRCGLCSGWEENYGCCSSSSDGGDGGDVGEDAQTAQSRMVKACFIITFDSKIFCTGLIQGLTEGALQIFLSLWSPAMRHLISNVALESNNSSILSWKLNSIGMDNNGEPAHRLIFGAFML